MDERLLCEHFERRTPVCYLRSADSLSLLCLDLAFFPRTTATATTATANTNTNPFFSSGDSTRHKADGLPLPAETLVGEAVNFTNALFELYYPNVPIVRLPVPDLGNNDFPGDYALNVTSTTPCLPDETGQPPPATNAFLQRMAELNRAIFATPMEAAIFACGGYVNRRVLNGLSIISLNTVLWSLRLTPPLSQPTEDAFGQHAWLKAQLQDAREYGYQVYITGHIAPILQSFVATLGQPLWQPYHCTSNCF